MSTQPEISAALALVVGLIRHLRKKGVLGDEEVNEILQGALDMLPGHASDDVVARQAVEFPGQFTR